MVKKSFFSPLIFAAVGVLVFAVTIYFYQRSIFLSNNDQFSTSSLSGESEPTPPSSSETPPSGQKPTTTKPQPAKLGISFTAPKTGSAFVVGQSNIISWTAAGKYPGALYLLNAADGQVVGTITSNTAPAQTSFTWDARSIFLKRYSPTKKDLAPGTYAVKLVFDGPITPVVSNSFSVIYPSQVEHRLFTVTVNRSSMTPATFSASVGDTVVILNNDNIPHTVGTSHFGTFTIAAGTSQSLTLQIPKNTTFTISDQVYAGSICTISVQ